MQKKTYDYLHPDVYLETHTGRFYIMRLLLVFGEPVVPHISVCENYRAPKGVDTADGLVDINLSSVE
jgi:hypothetical protein